MSPSITFYTVCTHKCNRAQALSVQSADETYCLDNVEQYGASQNVKLLIGLSCTTSAVQNFACVHLCISAVRVGQTHSWYIRTHKSLDQKHIPSLDISSLFRTKINYVKYDEILKS